MKDALSVSGHSTYLHIQNGIEDQIHTRKGQFSPILDAEKKQGRSPKINDHLLLKNSMMWVKHLALAIILAHVEGMLY